TPHRAWSTDQAGSYMFGVLPDETKLYAANFDAGTVTAIDLRSGKRTQLTIGGKPIGIDASPDGREVWVSALGTDAIAILSTATDRVVARLGSGGKGPDRLKFTPDGGRVVVTQSRSNEVVVLDARRRTLLARIPTGEFPKGLLLAPDGKVAWVS